MPRPDVAKLGLQYRRIPILAIGNDVILESSLQLERLEQLPLGADAVFQHAKVTPDVKAVQFLVTALTKAFFRTAAMVLPLDGDFLQDKDWIADRAKLLNFDFAAAAAVRQPSALVETAALLENIETLLADGRDWVLGSATVTPVDVEAVWIFLWLERMKGGFPDAHFGKAKFPRVRAWMERFNKVLEEAKAKQGPVEDISGDEASKLIKSAALSDVASVPIQANDLTAKQVGVSLGDHVTIWTNDVPNAKERDSGKLLALTNSQVWLEVSTAEGSFRLQTPRSTFSMEKSAPRSNI